MSPPTALSSLHLIQIAPESCSYPPPLPIKEPTKILQKFVLFDNSQASTMDTTPPSHRSQPRSRTNPASRLSKLRRYDEENESLTPRISLEIVPSPRLLASPTMSPNKPPYSNNLPLHELLLLSPSPSPLRKSRTRLADKLELADDAVEPNGVRRRRRSRNSAVGASPRNNRRSRRRLEQEMREDRDLGLVEEVVKPRKKRNSEAKEGEGSDLINRIELLLSDLVMWRDVARSSLWFGLGSLCFLSSCFAKGVTFSIFSIMSQLGLLFLVVSFFSHSIRQRDGSEVKSEFQLTEDDILRMGRLILPAANLAISKTRELFSGEPAMTLKLVPVLLIGAEYGHLITVWRLCAIGFFISFTAPKLYSCYSSQISNKANYMKCWMMETWGACSHKKMIAASVLTAFWNLTTVRTRIFTAFICLVIFRYCRQHVEAKVEEEVVEEEEVEVEEEEQQQALVVLETTCQKGGIICQ
ncbi:reticulon-like protein B17 isoform X2 [Nicotiana tabacum]|uniref:Reticulon-like protein n=2 Tax=Nicotiana TaxID=4085 RepID=A0A1S4B417_TOBAC|nr:PREDICTED: reticulon-like protein B17 isoform X2 [Nicotiana sylvestris]XP_016483667.1 PREDICTED: reticulon-like protein B17 isoform X2 [Nicotiana tabacum]